MLITTLINKFKQTLTLNLIMTCAAKTRLRDALRESGKAVGKLEREQLSKEIIRLVEQSPRFGRATVVAAYIALPDELSTISLLCRSSGSKKFVLPAIESGEMIFREYTGESDLCEGVFGIPQPLKGRITEACEIELMLVPGMAFDSKGHRLGRGKGFYDRYLSAPEASHIHKVGICMPHQLVDSVPTEAHDIIMDEVFGSVSV